jgi:hypothetical protein
MESMPGCQKKLVYACPKRSRGESWTRRLTAVEHEKQERNKIDTSLWRRLDFPPAETFPADSKTCSKQ